MKLVLKLLIFISLFSSCRLILNWQLKREGAEGYYARGYEWVSTPKIKPPTTAEQAQLNKSYNLIPEGLKNLEDELDKMILKEHCYKFLYNIDSTKSLAFFLVNTKHHTYDTVTKIFGSVSNHGYGEDIYQNKYLGYTLWGMNYQQKWYFNREWESEFYNSDDSTAKLDYLYYILNKDYYFDPADSAHQIFWNTGGKRSIAYRIRTDSTFSYIGYPETVASFKNTEIGRIGYKARNFLEVDLPLLNKLNLFDSLYSYDKWPTLMTDWDRKYMLLGVDFESPSKAHYLVYLFYDLRNKDIKKYLWTNNTPVKIVESEINTNKNHLKGMGYEWTHMKETVDSVFWDNQVLKQHNGKYVFLKELPEN